MCFLKEEFGKFWHITGWKIAISSKMAKLNQNKNWEHPDRPDAVWKICFALEINE